MSVTSDDELREVLACGRIAVVGCSRSASKAAHRIPAYMQRHGYEVVPVNPRADELLGEQAYDSLADVAGDVELVNVFRPSDEVPAVVNAALKRRDERGDVEAIWLQSGIEHDAAAKRAEAAGIAVVQDRCLKVEHRRLL